jgi:uncharacterized protein YhdP
LLVAGLGASERNAGKTLFTIDSDLKGLAIDMPSPLKKAANEPRAAHVEIENAADSALLLRGALGSVRSVARVQKQTEGWSFDRAGVRADGMAASLPAHTGLRIEGALNDFVLDDWLKLGSAPNANTGEGGGKAVNEILRGANVNVGRFHLYGYEWPNVRGVLQATDQGWQVDVSGPQATGQVTVPYRFDAAHPLKLNLEHLALNKPDAPAGAGTDDKSTLDPRDMPALQVDIKQFEYGEHNFGELHLQAAKVPQGLQVSALRVSSDAFMGAVSGTWSATSAGQLASVSWTWKATICAAPCSS